MEISRQNQTAGDNAQQWQLGNVTNLTVVNGITEQRAREIFREMNQQAMANYTQDAYAEALRRISILENSVMKRAEEVEGVIEAFSDPAFQILLAAAQKRAAATERDADYQLLSELLVCHVQKGAFRTNRAGINKAVEIVSDIDTIALCALTVAHAVERYVPIQGNISVGLRVLNDMFSKLIYEPLPVGDSWIDHLDILGAVRLSHYGQMRKMDEYYANRLNGYVCTGIQRVSDDYKRAVEILAKVHITSNLLVDNECLDGYVRLDIRSENVINEMVVPSTTGTIPLSAEQIDAIRRVWALYTKDARLKRQAERKFIELWDNHEALSLLKEWWDKITVCFDITQVGRVLAYTNAKRCDRNIPDLL